MPHDMQNDKSGGVKCMSYGELIDDLPSAWRSTDAITKPRIYDSRWVYTLGRCSKNLKHLVYHSLFQKPSQINGDGRKRSSQI